MLQVTSAVAHREARTHGRQWHFYYPFVISLLFPYARLSPILSLIPLLFSLHPTSSSASRRYLHAFYLQKRTFHKNRDKSSVVARLYPKRASSRIARICLDISLRLVERRWWWWYRRFFTASRVSNTCSKQSARGSFYAPW